MHDVIYPAAMARGQVDGFLVSTEPFLEGGLRYPAVSRVFDMIMDGRWTLVASHHNAFLYEWGTIIQNLLRGSPDGKAYNIGGMYLEFDNSGVAVNPTPTVNRVDSLSYYNDLNSNDADRDYLRLPLLATSQDTSDVVLFPKNNISRFIAQTAGTTGIHGNTYSDGSNSRVYGGALVAFLDESDASQDIILSRFYFPAANQILKPTGSQIGITWSTIFV